MKPGFVSLVPSQRSFYFPVFGLGLIEAAPRAKRQTVSSPISQSSDWASLKQGLGLGSHALLLDYFPVFGLGLIEAPTARGWSSPAIAYFPVFGLGLIEASVVSAMLFPFQPISQSSDWASLKLPV